MILLTFIFFRLSGSNKAQTVSIIGQGSSISHTLSRSSRWRVKRSNFSGRSDISIVEKPYLLYYQEEKNLICSFKHKIPAFNIFRSNSNRNNVVFIYQDVEGAYEISSLLFSKNYTVIMNESLESEFIIISHNASLKQIPENYNIFDFESSDISFIKNAAMTYYLFAESESELTKSMCHIVISEEKIQIFTKIMIALFVVLFVLSQKISFDYTKTGNNFWIVDPSLNVIYGEPFDNLEYFIRKSLEDFIIKTFKCKNDGTTLFKVKRTHKYLVFGRISAYFMENGMLMVIMLDEHYPQESEVNFRTEFESDSHELSEEPKITISSFRDYRPVHVDYFLDKSVHCVADLSSVVLSPFQPYGHSISIITTLMIDFINTYTENSESTESFKKLLDGVSKNLSASHAVCFFYDELVYSYKDIELTKEQAKMILETKEKQLYDVFEKGKMGYVTVFEIDQFKITTYIQINEVNSVLIRSVCPHYFTHCSAACYQIYRNMIDHSSVNKTISSFVDTGKYSFILASIKNEKIIEFRDNYVTQSPQTTKELVELVRLAGFKDVDEYVYEITKLPENIEPKIVTLTFDTERVIEINSIVYYDPLLEDHIAAFMCRNITQDKNKENELKKVIPCIQQIMDKHFKFYRFHIIDGVTVMDNDELFEELGHKTSTRHLIEVVDPIDAEKVIHIKNDNYFTISLIDNKSNLLLWFVVFHNGNCGYIFNIANISEAHLRFSNDRFQFESTSAQLIFWAVDTHSELVYPLYYQPTIWDALSVNRDTKFSEFESFLHKDDQEEYQKHYHNLLLNRETQWNAQIRLLKIEGTFEWYQIVMARSHDTCLHCLLLNIHKQKEIEVKLMQTQKMRDILLSSAKLCLWKFDNKYEDYPPMKKFDPSFKNSVFMNWKFVEDHVHPDYQAIFKKKIQKAYKTGKKIEVDLPLILESGEIWVSCRGRLRSVNGQLVGVCIDITGLRDALIKLEKEKKHAEEANVQKINFLANMSHEIRTPMNGVFGMLDILALQQLTGEQKMLVNSIRNSSIQLMKLLNDTLNLSKIDHQEIEVNPVVFNFISSFEPVCLAVSTRINANPNISFIVKINKRFPTLMYGDPNLLIQIMNNLLSNAMKFTKKGSITVDLSWEFTDDDNDKLVIIVSDTGIGMSEEGQGKIFERFEQANPDVTRYYGGTGIGLALVKEISDRLGGTIEIESILEKGSKFTCRLPYKAVLMPFSPRFCDGRRHVILTHIDDELVKESVADWLTFHKYEVVELTNPEDIIKYATTTRLEAIFVEGDHKEWPAIKQVVARINPQPIVCSLCEAGEATFFDSTLPKPVLMPFLFNFINNIRFKKEKVKSQEVTIMPSEKPTRILVVEDNKANQFVMQKILQKLKCEFRIAENGKEAIEILDEENGNFSMIFMDCQMPVLDGIEATKIIRRSEKDYSHIPIVALTASAVEGDEQTCRAAGMDDYLSKPVRIAQITNSIKQYGTPN